MGTKYLTFNKQSDNLLLTAGRLRNPLINGTQEPLSVTYYTLIHIQKKGCNSIPFIILVKTFNYFFSKPSSHPFAKSQLRVANTPNATPA